MQRPKFYRSGTDRFQAYIFIAMAMEDETSASSAFYSESLKILNKTGLAFMVGGTMAVNAYVGTRRPTKDMDIFCRAGDYPKIIEEMMAKGYKTQVMDERWLAKIFKGKYFIDVIFNSANAAIPVTDDWLKESVSSQIFQTEVKLLPPAELLWSKAFIQNRNKYDGNDIAHLILRQHKRINWQRLLAYMDQYWETLLVHILNFRFIYPSEREKIPKWLLDELLARISRQAQIPSSRVKICRGRLYSNDDFEIDVKEWGFEDITGWRHEQKR